MSNTGDTDKNSEQENDYVQINSKEEVLDLFTIEDLIIELKERAVVMGMVVHLTFSDSGK